MVNSCSFFFFFLVSRISLPFARFRSFRSLSRFKTSDIGKTRARITIKNVFSHFFQSERALDDGTRCDVIDKSSLLFDLVTVRLSPRVSTVISIEISISFIRKVTSRNRFVAVVLTLPSYPVVFTTSSSIPLSILSSIARSANVAAAVAASRRIEF